MADGLADQDVKMSDPSAIGDARPKTVRCSDLLVQFLRDADTRCIFALSGNHIMAVFDALLGSGIELIHTRHEASCVHMADAWSRVTGKVGVALVTGGPGFANAVSALYTAFMAEAPLVLLSGHAPNSQRGAGAFQEMDQAAMAAPVTKASWTCAGVDHLWNDLARAFEIARSGRTGPVHLALPSDVIEASCPVSRAPAATARQSHDLDPAATAAVAGFLAGARHPLILVGPQMLTRAGRGSVEQCVAGTGVPVIGMESPRGIADPALGRVADVLARSDAIVLVGKRVDFTLQFGRRAAFSPSCRFWQIDADAREIDRARHALDDRLVGHATGDAPASLHALAALGRSSNTAPDWLSYVREQTAWRPPEWDALPAHGDHVHPIHMLRPLQALLDSHPDAVLICDGGEIGQWAQACLRAPHRLINGMSGSIGSSLPYAIAASRAVGASAPVVAVMGDGTIGFHLPEFDTAVRYGCPIVVVVGNDARWNAEVQIQVRNYGADRLIGCTLLPSRYEAAAAALGAHGEYVSRAEDMADALSRARHSGRPSCINVMIESQPAPTYR